MEDLNRERSSLTNNEKRMIIRVYQYFLNTRQCQTQRPDLPLRKKVTSVLGIGEATLARVVAEHNSSKNEKFSERSERRIQGHPRKRPDHNVVDLIHKLLELVHIIIFLLLETNYCTHLTKRLRLR